MARTLTKKQRGFVNDYAETGNGTRAALKNYNTKDYKTASVIATENLEKPSIQNELKRLGFDANNAKKVVAEILNKEYAEDKDRLRAADIIFNVTGEYAPTKNVNVNLNAEELAEVIKGDLQKFRS